MRLYDLLFKTKKLALQTENIPYEIIWSIMQYLTLLDIARLVQVDKHLQRAVNNSIWEYELPKQFGIPHSYIYDTEDKEIFKGNYAQLASRITQLKSQLNAQNYSLSCLSSLWSSQFFITPATILGAILGIGCFFQTMSEEEKTIEKVTHQTREQRLLPLNEAIETKRKNMQLVRNKFFPPPCTLTSGERGTNAQASHSYSV